MFPGAKIVVIDDDQEHLDAVVIALRKLGLACLSYHYPDQRPDAATTFGGVRLLITDINLVGGSSPGNNSATLGPITSLISRIIGTDNGPYALITWSTTDLHGALIQRLKDAGWPDEKQPFFSAPLEKAEFLEDTGKLKGAIENLMIVNPPFGAVLDWERRVAKATERVLLNVGTFSRQFPGDSPGDKMDHTLSKLAVDAFGQAHVADHRFEATNEALLPILSDAINTEFFSNADDGIWADAVTKYGEKVSLTDDVISKLNSAVNFEVSADVKPYRRGVVLSLPEAWAADSEFEKRFGAKPSRIRGQLLKLDEPKNPAWVLIQVQAACDFSQGNIGPIPFVLSAIVPETRTRKTNQEGEELKLPSTVWQSPRFLKAPAICDADFRFEVLTGIFHPLTTKTIEEGGFKVLGRLKDQIVSSIAYAGNTHNSRPGFISFR